MQPQSRMLLSTSVASGSMENWALIFCNPGLPTPDETPHAEISTQTGSRKVTTLLIPDSPRSPDCTSYVEFCFPL